MTQVFESITQYDNSFNHLITSSRKGLACPFFSLISAFNFMEKNQKDELIHFMNIEQAIISSNNLKTNEEITFNDLINLTDLNPSDIGCCSVYLINLKEFNLKELLTSENNFAIIFLKNAKFFVVLYDKQTYCIRDCHESFQYNFCSVDELIFHLNDIYQFDKKINVSGFSYDDYDSIEFIKIENKFKNNLNEMFLINDIFENDDEEIQQVLINSHIDSHIAPEA
jgi:hypothetical protein